MLNNSALCNNFISTYKITKTILFYRLFYYFVYNFSSTNLIITFEYWINLFSCFRFRKGYQTRMILILRIVYPIIFENLIILTMRGLKLTVILFLTLALGVAQSTLTCAQYINQLWSLYNTSQPQFAQQMAPYLIFSGKILEDMGFPISCIKYPANSYWEVEISLTEQQEQTDLTMYYGLCFTNKCNAELLNSQSAFFIDTIFQNMTETNYQINSVQFFPVNMEVQYTTASIVVCVIISLFIITRMVSSFRKWGKLCMTDSEEEALAIEMEQLHDDKEAGRMPEHTLTFWERYSLERALSKLFEKEESNKILAFSLFKLFSLPFVALGFLFFLSNYGSYNYFSFDEEIYQTFYAKVATFAYYLPDIFFFISGYVFTSKLIQLDEIEDNKQLTIIAAFARKMTKLYPLYFATILIYWTVTPTLHAGPLWNVYKDNVEECNSTWWRSLLMIDNWFVDGCFNYSWYVQVEFQFALLLSFLFIIYGKSRPTALGILYSLLFTSFVFFFVFSGKLPSSIQTAISPEATLYFQAFYSHIFFYLFGVTFSFIFQKESVRSFVRTYYSDNSPVFTSFIVVAFALIIFIILRPGVWDNALALELAFCRLGIMISFLIFFLSSMASQEMRVTSIHRLSKLTYSIILWIGLITSCGFWGLNTFAYVDGINLLQSSLTYLLISTAVGGALGVIFDFTPFTLAH